MATDHLKRDWSKLSCAVRVRDTSERLGMKEGMQNISLIILMLITCWHNNILIYCIQWNYSNFTCFCLFVTWLKEISEFHGWHLWFVFYFYWCYFRVGTSKRVPALRRMQRPKDFPGLFSEFFYHVTKNLPNRWQTLKLALSTMKAALWQTGTACAPGPSVTCQPGGITLQVLPSHSTALWTALRFPLPWLEKLALCTYWLLGNEQVHAEPSPGAVQLGDTTTMSSGRCRGAASTWSACGVAASVPLLGWGAFSLILPEHWWGRRWGEVDYSLHAEMTFLLAPLPNFSLALELFLA